MKNKEKHANEIVEMAVKDNPFGFHKDLNKIMPCNGIQCQNCLFHGPRLCSITRREWANAECEVSKCGEVSRFTEREKKYIWLNWDCNYVQRTLHGQVWFYSKRPRSNESISGLLFAYPQKILDFLNIPFKGIKKGETVSREEILGESDE